MWTYLGTYETVKFVQIQDARLAWLRLFLLAAIFGYVAIYEMWLMGGYLESTPVVGVVRFSLQQPTIDNCDPAEADCRNAFESVQRLPYCSQSSKEAHREFRGNRFPCEIYEAINAQVVTETSLVVLTRGSVTEETLVCGASSGVAPIPANGTCARTYEHSDERTGTSGILAADTSLLPMSESSSRGPPSSANAAPVSSATATNPTIATADDTTFYIAQSEAFTVLLDHAVTASKICNAHSHRGYACSAQSSAYQGRLYSSNQDLCQRQSQWNRSFVDYASDRATDNAPCYIEPNKTYAGLDFFSLDVLLQAAGVASLDDCIPGGTAHASFCKTYRESGATLLLNIYWHDKKPYSGRVDPHYIYVAQLVATSYKQSIPFYERYRSHRTLLRAHGIKIAVLLGGEFHQFRFLQFLITLTTALGLLAVATTVVDSCMLYVLPEKEHYLQAKYEQQRPRSCERRVPSASPQRQAEDQVDDGNGQPVTSADQESLLAEPLLQEGGQ